MMHNAYALHLMYDTDEKISLLKYRELIIKSLLGLQDEEREVENRNDLHYLMPLPATEKKEKPMKPCVVCRQEKKRKETRYFCAQCNNKPALCIGICFKNYLHRH